MIFFKMFLKSLDKSLPFFLTKIKLKLFISLETLRGLLQHFSILTDMETQISLIYVICTFFFFFLWKPTIVTKVQPNQHNHYK